MSDDDEKKRLMKDAWKEAFKEEMRDQYAAVGRWTARLVVMCALGLLLYLILWKMGWSPPNGSLKP